MPEHSLPQSEAYSDATFTDYSALAPDSVEQAPAESFGATVIDLEQRVSAIRAENDVVKTGHSSFYDITGNLLAVIGPCYRDWNKYQDEEALADCQEAVELLQAYLGLVQDEDILKKELGHRNGAYPIHREEADADKAHGRHNYPIANYIARMQSEARRKEGEEAAA